MTSAATPSQTAPLIAAEKYVAFTSYKRDGSPVSAPVWIVDLGDGTVGFSTAAESFKVKRVRRNPRVTLSPCDFRGRVSAGAPVYAGSAEVLEGADQTRVWKLVRAKYGIQAALIDLGDKAKNLVKRAGKQSPAGDCAIVITLTT